MILANAYHLHLRPGDELVRELGGLHRFMEWDGPILTDSGGFQVFSLETLRTVDEDGVEFRSHIDGSRRRFTPEIVMRIERNLGADVIMQFDHVIPGQTRRGARARRDGAKHPLAGAVSAEPSSKQSVGAEPRITIHGSRFTEQALFPIVQGGIHADLRREAARADPRNGRLARLSASADSRSARRSPTCTRMLDVVHAELPRDRPRYLMGVGFPEDLVEGVRRGVDLFDCVAPTRMGRNGTAFTRDGPPQHQARRVPDRSAAAGRGVRLRRLPRFSRAYIRHLFVADEILGLRLLSLHNVHFLVSLMRGARAAIRREPSTRWSQRLAGPRYHSRPESEST